MAPLLLVVLAFAAVWLAQTLLLRTKRKLPLPPGPKPLPLIGNVLDMPREHEWLAFTEWGRQYGPLVHIDLLGQPMLIVNSAAVASELLEKRGNIYSDRPPLTMASELVGWRYALGLSTYGDQFREYRKMIHRWIGSARLSYKHTGGIQEDETRRFLRRLLNDSSDLGGLIRKTTGAIILKTSHGYDALEEEDPIVELIERVMKTFTEVTAPGAFLVDVFPWLQRLPEWLPGTGFQRSGRKWRRELFEAVNAPHAFVKKHLEESINRPSYTSELLLKEPLDTEGLKESHIKWSAFSLYAGGADTTVSSIHTFFLAMTLNPSIQAEAQREIDSIVGSDRLPTAEDRAQLPYVDAIIKEVLRWHPIGPLGVPHRVTEDDTYDGYHIAKGTIIISNIWNMTRDSDVYANPDSFDPARHLAPRAERDPREFVFGFGRRICPGLHLADAALFVTCAMVLSVFNVSKAVDEHGHVVEPLIEYTSGTITHPKPFECSIKPRSKRAEALIVESAL